MVISTNLKCWLCSRSYRLRLELYAGTELGTPHFWCRECCDPHRLKRLLKKVLSDATRQPTVHKLNDEGMAVVQKILAALDGTQTPTRPLYERRWDADRPENEQDEVSDEGEALEMAAAD